MTLPNFKQVLRFGTSMKAGIGLLLMIILLAAAGTALSPGRPVFDKVGLGDIYHSKVFVLLLFLLCVNLLLCSGRRLRAVWRETFGAPQWPGYFTELASFPVPYSWEELKARLPGLLRRSGYRVTIVDGHRIAARRGTLAAWGILLVHGAILLIAAGGFYGSLAGFHYRVALAPGESTPIKSPARLPASQVYMTLASFQTVVYPGGGVSDWVSEVRVGRPDDERMIREIRVNQPLVYEGVTIYQASHSFRTEVEVRGTNASMPPAHLVLQPEECAVLDERSGLAITPLRYIPDFDPEHPRATRSPTPLNPVIVYGIYSSARAIDTAAVAIGQPIAVPGYPATLTFVSAQPISGLEIKYDPGWPMVLAGLGLLGLAIFPSLYIRRRAMYIEVSMLESGANVAILGTAGHGPSQRELATIYTGLLP